MIFFPQAGRFLDHFQVKYAKRIPETFIPHCPGADPSFLFRTALWGKVRVREKSGAEGRGRPASPPGSGGKGWESSSKDLFTIGTEEKKIGL
jgi:hypothetical protein